MEKIRELFCTKCYKLQPCVVLCSQITWDKVYIQVKRCTVCNSISHSEKQM